MKEQRYRFVFVWTLFSLLALACSGSAAFAGEMQDLIQQRYAGNNTGANGQTLTPSFSEFGSLSTEQLFQRMQARLAADIAGEMRRLAAETDTDDRAALDRFPRGHLSGIHNVGSGTTRGGAVFAEYDGEYYYGCFEDGDVHVSPVPFAHVPPQIRADRNPNNGFFILRSCVASRLKEEKALAEWERVLWSGQLRYGVSPRGTSTFRDYHNNERNLGQVFESDDDVISHELQLYVWVEYKKQYRPCVNAGRMADGQEYLRENNESMSTAQINETIFNSCINTDSYTTSHNREYERMRIDGESVRILSSGDYVVDPADAVFKEMVAIAYSRPMAAKVRTGGSGGSGDTDCLFSVSGCSSNSGD